MNHLQRVFDYKGHDVRTIFKDNEPWFVASDVCKILEIQNVTQALQRLEENERSMFNIGRQGNANIINESGLYELIFASRKFEAKTFKRWVKQEVLPSIRKHGAYMTPEKIEEVLLNPDTIIKIATQLKEEQQKRIAAEQRIKQQQPFVNFAEACMTSDKSLLVREVAKLCSKNGITTGERRLWQKLREWKLVFANKNEPYQEYIDRGYFEIAQGVKGSSKGAFTWLTMRVTQKGQAYIINRLKKEQQTKAVI